MIVLYLHETDERFVFIHGVCLFYTTMHYLGVVLAKLQLFVES